MFPVTRALMENGDIHFTCDAANDKRDKFPDDEQQEGKKAMPTRLSDPIILIILAKLMFVNKVDL